MRYIQVSEQDINMLLKELENEPSVPGDGINEVRSYLSSLLESIEDIEKTKNAHKDALSFNDIKVGKTYALKNQADIKKELRGALFEITDKKRTRVTGILKKTAGRYAAGRRFSLSPENMEEIE